MIDIKKLGNYIYLKFDETEVRLTEGETTRLFDKLHEVFPEHDSQAYEEGWEAGYRDCELDIRR